jgi:hypothetical protein
VFGWEYGVDLGAVYSLYGYEPPGFRGDIFGEIKRPIFVVEIEKVNCGRFLGRVIHELRPLFRRLQSG